MQSWYVLHTKPNKERQVQDLLAERRVEAYLPLIPTFRANRRIVLQPFFARYLFVRADLDLLGRWFLHYFPGSHGLVTIGEEPAKVSDQAIARIREQIQAVDGVAVHGDLIVPGDSVVFVSGPFAEWRAIFDRRLDSAGRAAVLIQLLEKQVRIEADLGMLQKTSSLPNLGVATKRN